MTEDLTKATAPYRLSDSGKLLVRGDEPLVEAIDADRALMQRIADLLNYGDTAHTTQPAAYQWMTHDGWSVTAGPKDECSELEWRPLYAHSEPKALLAARDEYCRLMGRHAMPAREMKKHDDLVREARNQLAAEALLYCHKIVPYEPAALSDRAP